MKIYLSLITAAALALSACGQDAPKPAEQAPAAEAPASPAAEAPAAESSAPAAEAASGASAEAAPAADNAAAADECKAVVSSDDAMKFDTAELNVKSSCQEFHVTLKHTGKTPKAAMGHNIVVAKAADKDGVLADGAAAGIDKDYLKEGDERVVAASKMIGGGEEDTFVVPVAKLEKGADYAFFCTFPGHSAMMSGVVKVVD